MAPGVLPTTVPTPAQWLFPPAALARTPSRADGLTLQAELDGRKEACTFAARLSMTLRQGPTMYDCAFIQGAASLFIHRFYMRNSLKDYPPKEVAVAAVFLAFKDCEKPVRLKDVVLVTLGKLLKDEGKEAHGQAIEAREEFGEWTRRTLVVEEQLSSSLCWQFIPALPFQMYSLGLRRIRTELREHQAFRWERQGWAFMNECMADPLPVLQPPSIIASAAYVLTAVVFEGTPYAALLDTFETWRPHFGVDNTSDKDASDVRECMLWIIRGCARKPEIRHVPELASLLHTLPKPLDTLLPRPSSRAAPLTPSSSSSSSSSFTHHAHPSTNTTATTETLSPRHLSQLHSPAQSPFSAIAATPEPPRSPFGGGGVARGGTTTATAGQGPAFPSSSLAVAALKERAAAERKAEEKGGDTTGERGPADRRGDAQMGDAPASALGAGGRRPAVP